ncbi:MAG: hypothetical protein ACR2NN_00190 [Bryobacteraceae bacterium]
MKFLVFGVWMIFVLPNAISQQADPVDHRLHVYGHLPAPKGATLTAMRIEREAPALKWSPGVVHLKGNVEIKTVVPVTATQEPASTSRPRFLYMFVHADAADYHEDTGAIDAHGDVHITFEPRN